MARTDTRDSGRIRLQSGEGRRIEGEVDLGSFCFAGTPYSVTAHSAPVVLADLPDNELQHRHGRLLGHLFPDAGS